MIFSADAVYYFHCKIMSLFLIIFLSLSIITVATDNNVEKRRDDGSFDIVSLISKLPTNKFYINGTWVEPTTTTNSSSSSSSFQKLFVDVVDPSEAETIAKVALGGLQDIDDAVMAAKDAWIGWSYYTSSEERQRLVRKLIQIFHTRIEDMAQLISTEMGSPIDSSRSSHVWGGIHNIKSALEMMDDFEFERSLPNIHEDMGQKKHTTILYEPIGIVGMITPWNWPLNQITLKVIPALLVGCTCILKPSEESPLSALLFAEMMHEAGFPPGVFNLVNGDGQLTGDALTKHPSVDMISFTGSTRAGKQVAKNAALSLTRTALELGGKGALLIFADVGTEWMEEVVINNIESVFYNSGQSCNAATRMFIEQPYYDMAINIAKNVAQNSPVDSAHLEGEDHIGPVVNLHQFERIQNYIQSGIDEGAMLISGGTGRPENLITANGYYVRPTIFADCTSNMTIMQEEIFGPVLCISSFVSETEALDLANDTPYGLTNYVHTRNAKRRRRMGRLLRSGMVEMNDAYGDSGSPFGGVKGSGYGRENGIYGLEEFCIVKAVTGYDEMDDDILEEEIDDYDEEEVEL